MQYENTEKTGSLLNLDVLASFAIIIGVLFSYYRSISGHFEAADPTAGIYRYSYFMLAMTCISFLILFLNTASNNTGGSFIWLPVCFVLFAFISTVFSGLYDFQRLPFRFINMFYWVAIMLLCYYAVLTINTVKFHVALVVLALPLLSYIFYGVRWAELAFRETLTLNPGYFVIFFMPVAFLLKSKGMKIGVLLLIFAVTVLSGKRLGFLAFLMSILVYFYCLTKTDPEAGIRRNTIIVLGFVLFSAVLAFAFRRMIGMFDADIGDRMRTIFLDEGSGRMGIYRSVISAFLERPGYLLIGHGYEALALGGMGWAHNDFLEILYSFGIIGLSIYILFVIKLVKIFFEMKRYRYRHLGAFGASLVWFFLGSMFSILVIHTNWFLALAVFWGITVADFENAKKQMYLTEIEDSFYTYDPNEEVASDEIYAVY